MKGYLQLPQVCYGLTVAKRPYTIPCNHRVRAIDVAHVNRFEVEEVLTVLLETKGRERGREAPSVVEGLQYRFSVHFLLLERRMQKFSLCAACVDRGERRRRFALEFNVSAVF